MGTGTTWRRPEVLLLLMAAAMPLSHFTWMALINNFAVERAAFSGAEMGLLQSLREVPGFLSFTVVFVLLLFKEQTLALLSLALLGVGTAITGYFPYATGLIFVTVLASVGFHYYESLHQSLSLQWLEKDRAPAVLGRLVAVGSFAGLVAFGGIFVSTEFFNAPMEWVYLGAGGTTVAIAVFCWFAFPRYPAETEQRKTLVLRKRYWLYYALTFFGGARRQIFNVFAGFMLVEKFGFDVSTISLIYLVNGVLTMMTAPFIGRMIARWGERRALTVEYIGLVCVFSTYAFVEAAWLAIALYIVDHFFFAMAIAQKTYFQKIADPKDMASTAGVAFTINHIAAVALPASLGLVWLISPAAVFLTGAALAAMSLALARLVPRHPEAGAEALWTPRRLRVQPEPA